MTTGTYLRVFLSGARAEGWDFERAWESAFDRLQLAGPRAMLQPEDRHRLTEERALLEETRPRWQAAYENREPLARERSQVGVAAWDRLPDLYQFAERRSPTRAVEKQAA